MFTKQEILGFIAFFVSVFLFAVFFLPVVIDREIARQEVVAEYNCKQYGACGQ